MMILMQGLNQMSTGEILFLALFILSLAKHLNQNNQAIEPFQIGHQQKFQIMQHNISNQLRKHVFNLIQISDFSFNAFQTKT